MTDELAIDSTNELEVLEGEEESSSTTVGEAVVDILYGDKHVRWYQIAAVHGVEKALEMGVKRILIVLPTGAGKTLTSGLVFSSDRVRKAIGVKPGEKLKLLFIAHKHRLLTQAEKSYADASLVEFIPHSAFQDLPEDMEWDIACIDEAHHEAMATIQYRLDKLGKKCIIGLTATPDRADGCLIKFEAIIDPITREEAVAQGFLAETDLNSIVDTPAHDKVPVTKMIIDEFLEEFGQTMMFFRTKKEVQAIAEYLHSKGKKVVAIVSQSDKALDILLDQFSAGEVQFLINCNKINEGVDVFGCTDVFLGRSYGSYPQLNQVIGRASRPDSECRVWELVNPLSGRNLDTTVVVGTPRRHRLISKRKGKWVQQNFDYVTTLDDLSNNNRRRG